MTDSDLLICQAANGQIKIDVRLEDETVNYFPELRARIRVAAYRRQFVRQGDIRIQNLI